MLQEILVAVRPGCIEGRCGPPKGIVVELELSGIKNSLSMGAHVESHLIVIFIQFEGIVQRVGDECLVCFGLGVPIEVRHR